ncbi:hypothetical protein H6F43_02720 [Leptolyngbya sp. FACHB-36]|uniref:hypothetical protein n=1 Tax=Leptolyngbya sp. FACHB-36 TaxID=2692808 RepID=UPI0016811B55|nr:hypothetical protein [Leptolyngbya sp. FACHB-36]MBD2019098.1 hypothetical protein [Leptolyngbya sp. FACHB-36]
MLGALSYLPHREVWNLALVASIHDAQALGASLVASLQGTHQVQFNDHKRTSLVSVTVLSVVEEGVGAIAECRHDLNTDGTNLLLDLGNGTTSLSVFGPRGKLEQRSVEPYGVEELIDAIARNLNTRRKWSKEGDRHLIRSGIETRSFTYGNTKWNFRSIYDAELKPWATKALAPVLRRSEQWMASSDAAIAIGGGSQLPAIRELLTRKGIAPLAGGVFANALGLLKIARAKQGQLGG